jgi:ADP-ribose pyrophosphatase
VEKDTVSWKKISSKVLLDHPRISIIEDQVILPNGKTTDYIKVGKRNNGAMIIAENSSGEILVLKEYNYPTNSRLYELPGGGIEENETPEAAAHRELAEEGGLSGDIKLLGWFYANNRRTDTKMYVYLATNLSPVTAQQDDEESFERFWMTPNEIDDLIKKGEFQTWSGLSGWAFYKAIKN